MLGAIQNACLAAWDWAGRVDSYQGRIKVILWIGALVGGGALLLLRTMGFVNTLLAVVGALAIAIGLFFLFAFLAHMRSATRAQPPPAARRPMLDVVIEGERTEWVAEDPRRWKGIHESEKGESIGTVLTLINVRITNSDPEMSASITLRMYARFRHPDQVRIQRFGLDPVTLGHLDDLAMPIDLAPGRSVAGDISYYHGLRDLPPPEGMVPAGHEVDLEEHLSGAVVNLNPAVGRHRFSGSAARTPDERAASAAVARLGAYAGDDMSAKVVVYPATGIPLARKIAGLFELAGWKTYFDETPQESFADSYAEGVEVSGPNDYVVRLVGETLHRAGIPAVRVSVTENAIAPDNPNCLAVSHSVRVSVGHAGVT